MSDDSLAPGLFASVRGVFATLLQGASLRVELATVELEKPY
jgi:hypothetical protein